MSGMRIAVECAFKDLKKYFTSNYFQRNLSIRKVPTGLLYFVSEILWNFRAFLYHFRAQRSSAANRRPWRVFWTPNSNFLIKNITIKGRNENIYFFGGDFINPCSRFPTGQLSSSQSSNLLHVIKKNSLFMIPFEKDPPLRTFFKHFGPEKNQPEFLFITSLPFDSSVRAPSLHSYRFYYLVKRF